MYSKIILDLVNDYMCSENAATGIEYGLILAAVSLAIVVSVFTFGDQLNQAMEALAEAIAEGVAANG